MSKPPPPHILQSMLPRTIHAVSSCNEVSARTQQVFDVRILAISLPYRLATAPYIYHAIYVLLTTLKIPKMVPIDTPQSMLDEPSKGSKVTIYLPRCEWSLITIAFSSSSETSMHAFPDAISALRKISFAKTSSFLTSSPCTFASPVKPNLERNVQLVAARIFFFYCLTYRLIRPACLTLEATNLQPNWIEVSRRVKSPVASGASYVV